MSEPISIPPIGPARVELDPRQLRVPAPSTPATTGASFSKIFAEAIGEVERLQTEADSTIKQLVAGEIKDVTDAMIAVEKADVAFQTMMVVRNKVVAAYEEIMRMQV